MTKYKLDHFTETLRWFTSLDMAAERNALMERIYPRLKEFAQEKGYEFQVSHITLCLPNHGVLCVFDTGATSR